MAHPNRDAELAPGPRDRDAHRPAVTPPRSMQDWHRIGLDARRRLEGPSDARPASIARLAGELGLDKSYLGAAIWFAQDYDRAALDRLVALRRPDGTPLGFNHVRALLGVRTARPRKRLAARAAREGWGVDRLEKEVRRLRGGKGSRGGRRPRPPATPAEALDQIAEHTESWLLRYRSAWPAFGVARGSAATSRRPGRNGYRTRNGR